MPFHMRGEVRIHYEEAGTGYPLLVIPGGGLNSDLSFMHKGPFDPMAVFSDEYRVHRQRPAPCQWRPVQRTARARAPLGRLRR